MISDDHFHWRVYAVILSSCKERPSHCVFNRWRGCEGQKLRHWPCGERGRSGHTHLYLSLLLPPIGRPLVQEWQRPIRDRPRPPPQQSDQWRCRELHLLSGLQWAEHLCSLVSIGGGIWRWAPLCSLMSWGWSLIWCYIVYYSLTLSNVIYSLIVWHYLI